MIGQVIGAVGRGPQEFLSSSRGHQMADAVLHSALVSALYVCVCVRARARVRALVFAGCLFLLFISAITFCLLRRFVFALCRYTSILSFLFVVYKSLAFVCLARESPSFVVSISLSLSLCGYVCTCVCELYFSISLSLTHTHTHKHTYTHTHFCRLILGLDLRHGSFAWNANFQSI